MQGCNHREKVVVFVLIGVGIACGGYFWWGLTGVQPLQEKTLKFAEVRR